jgi:DNA topoisomerase-1
VECPECGSELIERVNKKKKKFYGCSNYPDCTFATNYKPLKQKCSKCGGLTTTYRQNYARCIKCGNRDKLQE